MMLEKAEAGCCRQNRDCTVTVKNGETIASGAIAHRVDWTLLNCGEVSDFLSCVKKTENAEKDQNCKKWPKTENSLNLTTIRD